LHRPRIPVVFVVCRSIVGPFSSDWESQLGRLRLDREVRGRSSAPPAPD
jgi:hypothetical protein